MARLNNITFACAEPVELAEFWRQALDYEHIETPSEILAEVEKAIAAGELDPTGWAMLVNPDGTGPRLLFQRRPKGPTTEIPIHLDLHADDRPAEVDRLVGIGAIVVEERSQKIGPHEEFWTVMKDPEGNGFCVS
ncbi:MAG TPA: VOC family protein [Gaiellaceae bacterium]|nr:VOC family protein [Gaiellaceae bacterium]